jgi:two-component system CheB/CheR fusion protein
MEETTKKEEHLPISQEITVSEGADIPRMICLGASAGGLEALERFFRSVPEDARDMGSARFDGMPRSAELTKVVDFIGTPEQIVSVLYEEVRESGDPSGESSERLPVLKVPPPPASPKERIFQKISDVFNVDFSQYKDATILRRLERRMALRGISEMKDYAEVLEAEAEEDELDHLYRDLLIDVTSFFRDTQAFFFLEEQILPEILQNHPEEQEFRVWVVACASGEEAYSMAIMLQEILARHNLNRILRVFATDIHQKSLRGASYGVYSEEKLKNLSRELREKYFLKKENGLWAVRPFVRRTITFAPHNILADPPFLHMNLISCRNMLIYLEKSAQLEVLTRFAAALELQGVLFLGKSESIPEELRDFVVLESRLKIYQKQGSFAARSLHALLPDYKGFSGKRSPEKSRDSLGVLFPILLDRCMPPGFSGESVPVAARSQQH